MAPNKKQSVAVEYIVQQPHTDFELALRPLLDPYCRVLHIDSIELAELICSQVNVGCFTFLQSGDLGAHADVNNEILCSLVTLLNIAQYPSVLKAVSHRLRSCLPTDHPLLRFLKSKRCGLLINVETEPGLPDKALRQVYSDLVADVTWTLAQTDLSEEESKEKDYYNFKYVLVIAEGFTDQAPAKPPAADRKHRPDLLKPDLNYLFRKKLFGWHKPIEEHDASDGSSLIKHLVIFVAKYSYLERIVDKLSDN